MTKELGQRGCLQFLSHSSSWASEGVCNFCRTHRAGPARVSAISVALIELWVHLGLFEARCGSEGRCGLSDGKYIILYILILYTLIYIVYMTLYCIILCYIQITRVLFSASPLMYTGTAHILTTQPYSYNLHNSSSNSVYSSSISARHIIIVYCVLYFTVGIALHVNFYPWTWPKLHLA